MAAGWLQQTVAGAAWPSVLAAGLTLYLALFLKESLQQKVVIAPEALRLHNGRRCKQVRYEQIRKAEFRRIAGFDAPSLQLLLVTLDRPHEGPDADSHNALAAWQEWLGVEQPDKTMTLDLSLFAEQSVYRIMIELSQHAPQTVVIAYSRRGEEGAAQLRAEVERAGGCIEPVLGAPRDDVWLIKKQT